MYEIAIVSFGYVICRFRLPMILFVNVSDDEKIKFYGQFKQRCVKVQKKRISFFDMRSSPYTCQNVW